MSDTRLTRRQEDEALLLQAAVGERLRVAVEDLGLSPALRLTDRQRTIVCALASKLVRTVEDALRATIGESIDPDRDALAAALAAAHVAIAQPILERARLLADPPLTAALLRRAEEHRHAPSQQSALLVDLIRDADEAVSEQAMAVLIAHSRRFDRFSEPIAARTELEAELQHRLVWRVAAALRLYMRDQHEIEPGAADEIVAAAAQHLLLGYDEGDRFEARTFRLVRLLDARGRLNDRLVERAAAEGAMPLLVAMLGTRAALSYASAWDLLLDPRGRGAVLLLKAARLERAAAAAILLVLDPSEERVAARLDLFDVTGEDGVRSVIRLWQIDPGYREAIAELSQGGA